MKTAKKNVVIVICDHFDDGSIECRSCEHGKPHDKIGVYCDKSHCWVAMSKVTCEECEK